MRTFGSLLKAGYQPRVGSFLYKKNEEKSYIEWCRWSSYTSNKPGHLRSCITRPIHTNYKPFELYIHPYFPEEKIYAVELIRPFPYGYYGRVIELENGVLNIENKIILTSKDIYLYPTFFKPIYNIEGLGITPEF